jgi:glycosyl transferase family 25
MNDISVRVISLPTSFDRRSRISQGLEGFALPWRFFDAVSDEYDDASLRYNDTMALAAFGRRLSRREIGCFHSHYTVFKEFLEDAAARWLIVFEDDLVVDLGFDFSGLVSYLESASIDCIRLYCRRWKSASVLGYFGYRQVLRFRTDPYGIQSYVINKRAAAAILANISDVRRPFDDELGRFWEHGVPIVGLFPFPVLEASTVSTLERSREFESHNRTATFGQRLGNARTRAADKLAKISFNLAWRKPKAMPGS